MRVFMLILHFLGLAMALGTGFANLFLGRVAAKLEPAERGAFMSKLMVLGNVGRAGLALLVVSGIYLITPYWEILGEMPFLLAKLVLIGVLLILVVTMGVVISRARKRNDPAMLAKLKPLGMMNFFVGIAIVVCAVMAFH